MGAPLWFQAVPRTSTSSKSVHEARGTRHILRGGLQQRALPLGHFAAEGDKAEAIFWAEVLQNLQQGIPRLFRGENNGEYFYSSRAGVGTAV